MYIEDITLPWWIEPRLLCLVSKIKKPLIQALGSVVDIAMMIGWTYGLNAAMDSSISQISMDIRVGVVSSM